LFRVAFRMDRDDKLDRSYAMLSSLIREKLESLCRTSKVRARRWLERLTATGLHAPTVRKRTRNDYAVLLLQAVLTDEFRAPLNVLPRDGALLELPVRAAWWCWLHS
jgi:hypothetical protein